MFHGNKILSDTGNRVERNMSEKINESIVTDEIREDMKKNRIDHMKYLPDMQVIDSQIPEYVIEAMNAYDYEKYTAVDVRRALSHSNISIDDFAGFAFSGCHSFYGRDRAEGSSRRHGSISEIRCICLHHCIFPITVKITVFIVDLTAIIRLTVQNWTKMALRRS